MDHKFAPKIYLTEEIDQENDKKDLLKKRRNIVKVIQKLIWRHLRRNWKKVEQQKSIKTGLENLVVLSRFI